jgi:hypothetical protein
MISKNEIYKELLQKQLKIVSPRNMKLTNSDLKRISRRITNSIFIDNKCSLWLGYISSYKNGKYVNFFYNRKKAALHRLIYCNYVGSLSNCSRILFTCNNKGFCFNVNHLKKFENVSNKRKNKISTPNFILRIYDSSDGEITLDFN